MILSLLLDRLRQKGSFLPSPPLSPWASPGSLFPAQSCNEEKSCLAPSLRRISGKSTTQLIHDRGLPLMFVAGEEGHGGSFITLERSVTLWL